MSLAARLDPPGAKRNDRPNRHSPYTRPNRDLPPADGNWVHDKFAEINDIPAAGGALASRISGGVASGSESGGGAKLFARAMGGSGVGPIRRAASGGSLSIKGASNPQSTILEIKELVAGTTADDVKAIFTQCGTIKDAWTLPSNNPETTVIRVKFTERDGMLKAIKQFDGQIADGRTLSVKEVPTGPAARQKDLINESMEEDNEASGSRGGKMYSDAIPGKTVTEPPKIEKLEKIDLVNDKWTRGGRGGGNRGRGRGGRGGRGRAGGNSMQVD